MKRTPLSRGTAGLRRTRLAPRSQRTIDIAPEHRMVSTLVLTRDRVCQVRVIGRATGYATPACRGPLTPHHRRKASQGGAYTVENLVAACAGCNGALEADADLARWAHSVGLVVRRGDAEWATLGATRR